MALTNFTSVYKHCFAWVLACVCVCLTGGQELHSDCLAVVQAPKVQVDPQLTLPLDINNYLITHYVQTMFRVITQAHPDMSAVFCTSKKTMQIVLKLSSEVKFC